MKPTPLSSRFDEALVFAVDLHRDQARKATRIPYVAHLLGTAALVLTFDGDEEQAIAALLHDAAEDQGGRPTLERIRQHFGDRVAGIVDACTDTYADPKPEWLQRKKDYIARIPTKSADARLVSAADKLDNARAILMDLRREGAPVWGRFTGGIKSVWYYRELVRAFREAGGGPIVDELDVVVTDIEGLAARTQTA
jgi:(p)ppGpp synthase/HD superfamily hydrolase